MRSATLPPSDIGQLEFGTALDAEPLNPHDLDDMVAELLLEMIARANHAGEAAVK